MPNYLLFMNMSISKEHFFKVISWQQENTPQGAKRHTVCLRAMFRDINPIMRQRHYAQRSPNADRLDKNANNRRHTVRGLVGAAVC